MKGFLLVADSVRTHGDGTFSLLRGGIDRVQVPEGEPLLHRGSVVVRIAGDASDAGKHEFTLRVEAAAGEKLAPEIKAPFEIPVGGGGAVAALDFGFVLPRPGAYRMTLSVGDRELDSWRVEILRLPAEKPVGVNN